MHAELLHILTNIGLSEKEGKVYMASLELGSAAASAIAKKADVDRVNTYNMLASLKERGVISEVEKRGVKYFTADSPEKLIVLGKESQKRLETSIGELTANLPMFFSLYKTGTAYKPRVQFYEGRQGYLNVYNKILEDKPNDIALIVNYIDFTKLLDARFEEDWIKKRVELGIHLRWLDFDSKEMRAVRFREKVLREIKFLPDEYRCGGGIFVYQHKIILLSTGDEFMAIIIENQEFAQLARVVFEMLWKFVAK